MSNDPYSTSANLSSPVVSSVIYNRDRVWLSEWLEKGKPHKRLAGEAFCLSVKYSWLEGINSLWASGWVAKRSLLHSAFKCYLDQAYKTLPSNTDPVWQWIMTKTYEENQLSKAEFNGLHIDLLNSALSNKSSWFWDLFFQPSLEFKGEKASELFWNAVISSSYYDRNKTKSDVNLTPTTLFCRNCVSQLLKKGVPVKISIIMEALFKGNNELFWQILNSDVKMSKPDMIVLLTYICIYYRKVKIYVLNEPVELVEPELEIVLQRLIAWGLPEKVTFSVKDLEEAHNHFNGYEGCQNLRTLDRIGFDYMGDYSSRHIPKFEHGYFNDRVVPVDFFVGDIFLAKPKESKKQFPDHKNDTNYQPLTEDERAHYRQDIKRFFI